MPSPSEKAALTRLRHRIDRIDTDLVELLKERHALAKEVASLKRHAGADRYIPWREKQILRRVLGQNAGRLPGAALTGIFKDILGLCRQTEKPLVVVFPGPAGSVTHAAARDQFGASTQLEPAHGLAGVFESVAQAKADYGVVPLETASEGIGTHAFEYFLESDLTITAEYFWKLGLVLAGNPRVRTPRTVFLAESILALCRPWLEAALPGARIVTAPSVAAAAQAARDTQAAASVCPAFTAETIGLEVLSRAPAPPLSKEIRFLTAGRSMPETTRADKTTIAFSLVDRVGVLDDALRIFRRRGVNLSLLDSYYPSKTLPTVTFFADFSGHASDRGIQRLLLDLRRISSFVKVLGSYPVFRS